MGCTRSHRKAHRDRRDCCFGTVQQKLGFTRFVLSRPVGCFIFFKYNSSTNSVFTTPRLPNTVTSGDVTEKAGCHSDIECEYKGMFLSKGDKSKVWQSSESDANNHASPLELYSSVFSILHVTTENEFSFKPPTATPSLPLLPSWIISYHWNVIQG